MNEDKQSKESQINEAPKPKVSELNKKLIAVIGALLGTAIVLAFLFSINTGQKNTQSKSSQLQSQGLPDDQQKKASVKNLPDSYEDQKQVDQILGLNQKPKVVKQVPDSIKQQLKKMRQQQSELKSKLRRLRSEKKQQTAQQNKRSYRRQERDTRSKQQTRQKAQKRQLSREDKQAMQSAVFFSGGSPSRPSKAKNQKDEKQKKDKVEQKRQTQKEAFMEGKVNQEITNQNTVQKPLSKYTIFAGSTIPGILQTKLISNNPGKIVARVTNDVYDSVTGEYLLIPKGSKLIGEYNSKTSYGDFQLQAKFIRLIRPDGTSIVLPNQAGVDSMGVTGFEDEVNNHWGQLIGAGILTTVFNIPAVAANYSQQQAQGFPEFDNPGVGRTIGNSALSSMGKVAQQIGGKMTDRAMNIKPTITINAGYQFRVLVTKDIVIPPYERKM